MNPRILEISEKNQPGGSKILLRWGKVGTIEIPVSQLQKIVSRGARCELYANGQQFVVGAPVGRFVSLIDTHLYEVVNEQHTVVLKFHGRR